MSHDSIKPEDVTNIFSEYVRVLDARILERKVQQPEF